MGTETLVLVFAGFLLVVVLVLWVVMTASKGRISQVAALITQAYDTAQSIGSSALTTANSFVGQCYDVANLAVTDFNTVLQSWAQSIGQIIITVGQSLVDFINFLTAFSTEENAALVSTINAFFQGLLQPIFDALSNTVTDITAFANALLNSFNPNSC
jgi:hypothetical protein